jgi:hypothetical protein
LKTELFDARFDRVPTRQSMSDRDVTDQAEIFRFENFVSRRVVEDRLGVDAGLVRERDVAAMFEKKTL